MSNNAEPVTFTKKKKTVACPEPWAPLADTHGHLLSFWEKAPVEVLCRAKRAGVDLLVTLIDPIGDKMDVPTFQDWLAREVLPLGDSVFQGTIRVIAFGLGVQLAQQGSIMGPILAMVISIIPSVLITWFAAKLGYQGGHQYLSKLQSGDLMEKLMYVCGIVGLMSVGGMIATLIGSTTPLQFADGSVVIQDILDGMMPQMIPLGLTGLMYWLIKKNVNTGWLLVIAIVGGIALSAAGILA